MEGSLASSNQLTATFFDVYFAYDIQQYGMLLLEHFKQTVL